MLGVLDHIVRNSIENPAVPISSSEVLKIIGGDYESGTGITVNANKALGHTPIWKAINTLSSDVAKIPCRVLKRTENNGKEPLTSHAAHRLIRYRPNKSLTAFRWMKTMMVHALLRGNGYTGIRRRGNMRGAQPVGLVLLPPTPGTVPVIVDGELWFVTEIDGQQTRIRGEDVLHFPGLSYDGLEGLDVLDVMADAFGLEIAEHKHAERFFKRGTQTVGFLTAPKRLSDKELSDLRANWSTMLTGIENMHCVGVLHGGMDFKPLSIEPEKAQLLQSREFGLIEVANVFGMPPHKVGHPGRTSYNSLEQENQDYLAATLDPWLVMIEQEENEKLLSESEKKSGDVLIEFNRDAVLRTSLLDRVMGYRTMREIGVITGNQIAARENLPTFGDAGEQRYVPSNWVQIGSDGTPAAPATSQAAAGQITPQIRAAHVAAIADRLGHVAKYEQRQVALASKREKNFIEWFQRFYREHQNKLEEALLPAVVAFYSITGRVGPELTTRIAVRNYIADSIRLLLAVCDAVSQVDLPDAVSAELSKWTPRAEQTAAWICDN